ncbi:hypothetical protein ACSQ67_009868 [Phaseolus vulgaris]
MGLNMMNLKMVLLGMLCIGLIVCSSAREITEKNEEIDAAAAGLFCTSRDGHCPNAKECSFFCLSIFYAHGDRKRKEDSRKMGLKMMNLKIVLLGMICIGLFLSSSAREISEKNEESDAAGAGFCTMKQGNCPDNKACNLFCLSVFFPNGGSCLSNQCCCKS